MLENLTVDDVVFQFTIIVSIALIIQLTLEHSRVPGIVGLLLIGMLVGPDGLAILPEEPVIDLLGTIGLLFIMFMAGLEIDLDVVRHHKRETISFGLLASGFSLAPAVGVGLLAGLEWTGALLLGAALASHTLVAYPMVERLGIVDRKPVVAAIGGTLITDTLALVLLAILVQQPGSEGGSSVAWALPLALLAILAAVSLAVVPRIAARLLDDEKTTLAEKALFLLVVLLGLATVADEIGTEDILGAFLAGLCLNQPIKRRSELHEHARFVGRMLFIPFFFVKTGMRLDLAVFGQLTTWMLAAGLLAVVVFGKTVASILTGRMYGYSTMDRIVVVGLTLPQAAATLAVIVVGREMELIGDMVEDAVIVVIFMTCLAGPLLTRFAGSRLT
ncbi:cation:proton antiporter [Microvirga roseola]|uniref:cation:proton antiporter n=1 Tax=Microvirga roseola TaxID=2883126 RepID=UPI001E326111|nr:cation:proton antiporter [Microvirga roseola]